MTRVTRFSECVTCHGNHAVVRPTVALLEPLPATPCAFCHEPFGRLAEAVAEPPKRAASYQRELGKLLSELDDLEGEALFNALVERAQTLEFHTRSTDAESSAKTLRPEFARLFTKFRIGTTTFSYPDPVTGEPVTERVVRCGDCHAAASAPGSGGDPQFTSAELVSRMRELTALTARAERIVLTAQRGGVEVRDALGEIDQAVDAQIELEVMAHTFNAAEGSDFAAKQASGLEHAAAALQDGQRALDELRYRRVGLAVSLVFIALVLVGIALKIRQLA